MRRALPLLTGLGLGALMLGPALRPGYVLSYDMVFVPHPAITDPMFGRTGGFPRQVPSDAFAALLSAIPWSQQLILLSIFAIAATGAARLVPDVTLARIAAAVVAVWNPYVAERLLLGQWALLLGYAGLPWVLGAIVRRAPLPRLALAFVPAAIGGFAAMNLTALVAAGALIAVRGRGLVRTAAVLTVLALPWLVPALRASGTATDPAGVGVFAARPDTPLSTLGSLLSLGGIWNTEAVPPGYSALLPALLRLGLCLTALTALAVQRTPTARGALYAGTAGLALACVGISAPGRSALGWAISHWAGFGVLRDGQLFIGALALGAALGAGHLAAGWPRRAWYVIIAPVALLPMLAWGVFGQLGSVGYPRDWLAAQKLINADPAPGKALSLPWGAYRRPDWNDGRAVINPIPRMLSRRVVWNDGLQVGRVELAREDPLAIEADALLKAPGDPSEAFRAAGYRYVVIADGTTENRFLSGKVVLRAPTITVILL
ncbi:hypothetical protein GCM10010468_64070 [Actinocorallia longicatena]|uniref:Uncharacterized protein n=2 Tax=Actinocorallia longicatena TaxID=111803 RepID=A0ABP6QMA7_9ACTN